VLAVTTIIAYLVLLPRDLDDYAKSLVATAAFASNIFFYRQWGYFDAEAHTKPLLHTWSLAVEEQFYLVFPLLLVLLYRLLRRRRRVRRVLGVLALASFAWTLLLLRSNPAGAFFLAPARSWELLLGSALALGGVPTLRPRVAEYAALVGIVFLAVAVLGFTAATPFPGPAALLPCVGAALVIHAGDATAVSRVLRWRPLVFIGVISYSLYLWHWALLSLARHWSLAPLSLAATWGVIAIAFACSALSWRYVEQRFRGRRIVETSGTTPATPAAVFAWGAGVSLLAFALGIVGWLASGWPERVPPAAIAFDEARNDYNPRRAECHAHDKMFVVYRNTCRFGASAAAPRYAIWGDSHAAELVVALGELAERAGSAVRMVSYTACPPGSVRGGAAKGNGNCAIHEAAIYEAIRADDSLAVVFLVARYGYAREAQGDAYFVELGRVAHALADAGKLVVLIYPTPEYTASVPMLLARAASRGNALDSLGMSRRAFEAQRAPLVRALDAIRGDSRILMLDPAERLCDRRHCRIYADGHALYFDDDHLSVQGARYLAPAFARFFGADAGTPMGNATALLNAASMTPNRRR
jgi:peptidoglycan/LPS O-acetylase OafA/YrhL